MKSSWTAIAYRNDKTGQRWRVFGKTIDEGQAIIDDFLRKEKLGLLWLAHRRIGHRDSNCFELVFKQRRQHKQILRGVSKWPASQQYGRGTAERRARSVESQGKEMLDRYH